jgi:hypothetical protein
MNYAALMIPWGLNCALSEEACTVRGQRSTMHAQINSKLGEQRSM